MIVRIMGQGQWVLAPEHLLEMNELDRALEDSVAAGDEPGMVEALSQLLDGVRRLGTEVPEDVIVESDLVLPDVDISLDEVRALLASTSEYYGLIPDAEDELNEAGEAADL
ncbi:MAG: hypothetical protein QM713_14045 [Arachnia sp.]